MGALSILLIAAGAILTWAVQDNSTGFDLHTIGIILMIVGAVGVLLSLMFWSSWGGFGGGRSYHRQRTSMTDPGTGVTQTREDVLS